MLSANNISFTRYNNENSLELRIKQFNISVKPGEIVGLIGQSATGKTTIAELLTGFIVPHLGSIICEDSVVSQPNSPVSLVLQDYKAAVFNWMKVKDFIDIGKYKNGDLISNNTLNTKRILDLLSIDYLEKYPHEMSGGQIQKVQLARALRSGSKYLILDEPTSSLDIRFREYLLSKLKILAKEHDIGILFISHQLGEVIFASDRVYLIKKSVSKYVESQQMRGYEMKCEKIDQAQKDDTYLHACREAYDYIF